VRSRSLTPLTPDASRLTDPGTLYLVATPIGNLEDMTFRALRILREVDLVAAEDTRHSRKLFSHFGIATPLTSYFEHNEAQKGERLLDQLRAGKSVALISDAGTPAISDPGFLLVRRCRDEGIPVLAVPGPSAAVAALAVSGLPTERFAFEGFLPARSKARREALQQLWAEPRTTIFYEAPHRLLATLRDICEEMGAEREVAVARELTKLHEELFRGTAAAAGKSSCSWRRLPPARPSRRRQSVRLRSRCESYVTRVCLYGRRSSRWRRSSACRGTKSTGVHWR